MSRNSKAKRDARKKHSRPFARAGAAIRPHAHLLDGNDRVLGGVTRRGDVWLMMLGGEVVASTESAAMILAMLKHTANLRQAAGLPVQLQYSQEISDAATLEAIAEGKSLEEYLDMLEAERAERAERADDAGGTLALGGASAGAFDEEGEDPDDEDDDDADDDEGDEGGLDGDDGDVAGDRPAQPPAAGPGHLSDG